LQDGEDKDPCPMENIKNSIWDKLGEFLPIEFENVLPAIPVCKENAATMNCML
jgi:hypothetical protein